MHYCNHVSDGGATQWEEIRGLRATFTDSSTAQSESFQYGDLVASDSTVTVQCYTVPITTMVTSYNSRASASGIKGFKFSDYDANLYTPCYQDCSDVET
jgi:hypothetical protein